MRGSLRSSCKRGAALMAVLVLISILAMKTIIARLFFSTVKIKK